MGVFVTQGRCPVVGPREFFRFHAGRVVPWGAPREFFGFWRDCLSFTQGALYRGWSLGSFFLLSHNCVLYRG